MFHVYNHLVHFSELQYRGFILIVNFVQHLSSVTPTSRKVEIEPHLFEWLIIRIG
jgi:hypothetical protein